MMAVWIAGGLLLAVRLGYGMARVWWMERRATEITDEGWVRITDALARRLRVGRMVTLLREAHAVVPMTWGIVRPVVLLPADAEAWDAERRTVVLAHELAHVRRWDPLTQWIAHVGLALFWFHPLVWVAARKMREEREHACDDAVLSIGTRPVEYADHLLDIVRSLGRAEGPAAALAMARRSQFEGRLLAILDGATRREGVTRGLGFAALVVAAAAVGPLAALRAAAPRPQPAVAAAAATTPAAGAMPALRGPVARMADAVRRLADAPLGRKQVPTVPPAGFRPAPTLSSGDAPAAPVAALPSAPQPAAAAVPIASPPAIVPGASSTDLLSRLDGRGDPTLYAAIIQAADEIHSSTDRRLVLASVLEKPDLSVDNIAAIIRSARTMDSDTDKRLVLAGVVDHRVFRANPVPRVFLEALASFTSSTDERLVMEGVLEGHRLDAQSLGMLLSDLPRMGSDTDRRLVLSTVARTQTMGPEHRNAFLVAARTIKDDSERRLALDALLSSDHGAAAAVGREAQGARTTSSSGEQTWEADIELDRDDGRNVTLQAKGVVFGRARWDIVRIRPGGRLQVQDPRGGTVRRLTAVPGENGRPVYTYTVGGQPRSYDAAAREWFQALVRELTGS